MNFTCFSYFDRGYKTVCVYIPKLTSEGIHTEYQEMYKQAVTTFSNTANEVVLLGLL